MLTVWSRDNYTFVHDDEIDRAYIEDRSGNTWILTKNDMYSVLRNPDNLDFLVGNIKLTGKLY
jgi:hypothetical protein